MFVLLLALAAIEPQAQPAPPVLPISPYRAAGKQCENPLRRHVGPAPTLGMRPLNEEPAGKQLLGVMHRVDGCEKPIVVRENVK